MKTKCLQFQYKCVANFFRKKSFFPYGLRPIVLVIGGNSTIYRGLPRYYVRSPYSVNITMQKKSIAGK